MALKNHFSPHGKDKDYSTIVRLVKNGLYASIFFSIWISLIFYFLPAKSTTTFLFRRINGAVKYRCPDDIGRVYVYELPKKFNVDLLRRCRTLNMFTNMCPHVANRGLGRQVPPLVQGSSDGSWFATNQFVGEMIFHARVERHRCRTHDESEAELFYLPFYSGLWASSVFRQTQLPERDKLGDEFVEYLVRQPPWHRHGGADHFLATGRTAWDFMRKDGNRSGADFGANHLFLLPAVQNMTILTVERQPWSRRKQFAIPYPSYFHPRTSEEVAAWQEVVRWSHRTHLFSFVGGPRNGSEIAASREEILRQCGSSTQCLQSKCKPGSSRCNEPSQILGVMMKSEFCMQAPGDSFTRRSVFDSILAGCVPVFFSEHTAYTQYQWYLPEARGEYSVFIAKEKWGSIEEQLSKIPKPEVARMRDRVIELIPSLTYAHPNTSEPDFRDTVDIALEQLTQHVRGKVSVENT